ncbi:MAG: biotin--[Clostridia bacterium]|nr:biotin--[acetyl-CoA-carboxylase] ligase [Clostridia bacterium]
MNTKEKVIEILYNMDKEEISGEEIAKRLNVTRNSIWKAINSLKNEGYDITSLPNGYRLNNKSELYTKESINKHLKTDCDIIIYDKVDSTNNIAKMLAQQGKKEGTVVIAKSQAQGRGRMGRSFISDSENGLYMTIILRPTVLASECVSITVIGAVAVCEAIEKICGKECLIKWVNDIYINEKKVSGILTEAAIDFESGRLQYAIIGIGINVSPPKEGFSKEIEDIATAIYEKSPQGEVKSMLCAEIIDRFFFHYNKIEKKEFINKYREKSMIINEMVDVYVGEEIISGKAIDIDRDACLVVDTGKEIRKFNSGEARVRKNGKKA